MVNRSPACASAFLANDATGLADRGHYSTDRVQSTAPVEGGDFEADTVAVDAGKDIVVGSRSRGETRPLLPAPLYPTFPGSGTSL